MPYTLNVSKGKPSCFGVSWGYYVVKIPPAPDGCGTDQINSCFAFVELDFTASAMFLAHVSCKAEADSIKRFLSTPAVVPIKGAVGYCEYFVVTGLYPQEKTTFKLIESLNLHFRQRIEVISKGKSGVVIQWDGSGSPTITICDEITATNASDYMKCGMLGMQKSNSYPNDVVKGCLAPMPGTDHICTL